MKCNYGTGKWNSGAIGIWNMIHLHGSAREMSNLKSKRDVAPSDTQHVACDPMIDKIHGQIADTGTAVRLKPVNGSAVCWLW